MALGPTTTSEISPRQREFLDRVLLERALPYLVHDLFGEDKPMPIKSGDQIQFRRYEALNPATSPLVEMQNPQPSQASKTDLTATLQWFGDFIEYSERVDLINQDPVLTEFAKMQGEQLGQTYDILVRDILAATASSSQATGGSNAKTNGGNPCTEITRADINAVRKILFQGNARVLLPGRDASTGVGTSPGMPAFCSVINTDLIDDLEAVNGFQSVSSYPTKSNFEAERGQIGDVRFFMTTFGKKDTTDAAKAVYTLPFMGKAAFAKTRLSGSQETIAHPPGSAGAADALNTYGTMGWKFAATGRILNDSFIHSLIVTNSIAGV